MKTLQRIIVALALFSSSAFSQIVLDIMDKETPVSLSLRGKIVGKERTNVVANLPEPLVHLDFTDSAGGTKQAEGSENAVFIASNVEVSGDTANFGTVPSGSAYVESTEVFDALHDSATFTLTIWVNASSLEAGSGGNRIATTSRILPASGIDLVHEDDGQVLLGIDQWPDNTPIKSSAKLKTGEWTFIAVVKTAESVTLFVVPQGSPFKPDSSFPFTKPVGDSGGKLTLGHFEASYRSSSSASRMFRGRMKDFRLWKQALDHEKLVQIMTGASYSAPFEVVIDRASKVFRIGVTNEFHASFDTRGKRLWVIYESGEVSGWEPLYAGEGERENINFVLQSTNLQTFLKIE